MSDEILFVSYKASVRFRPIADVLAPAVPGAMGKLVTHKLSLEMRMSKVTVVPGRSLIGMLALVLALISGPVAAMAQQAHSSPEDRARFVSITRTLEEAPLRPSLRADREWALRWLTEAPDVSVNVDLCSLGGMEEGYPYRGEILFQYMFSMAVLVIQHPETANDPDAQQVAGAAGALRAYRAILGSRPDARSPGLDSLMEIERRGGLPEFIRGGSASCSAAR